MLAQQVTSQGQQKPDMTCFPQLHLQKFKEFFDTASRSLSCLSGTLKLRTWGEGSKSEVQCMQSHLASMFLCWVKLHSVNLGVLI